MKRWDALTDITYDRVSEALGRLLKGPLPGPDAQLLMAPRPRRPGWKPGVVPADARRSAALLLVYPATDGRAAIVLTERSASLGRHAGQVSFPGGSLDDGESVEDAALREAREEIGVAPDSVEVLGTLSPLHIPVSRFALHPVVARRDERPRFALDAREVASVIETTLSELSDPELLGEESVERPGGSLEVPYFLAGGMKVWGATAMVLAELLSVLATPRKPAI